MPRYPQNKARRGSQFHLQRLVNGSRWGLGDAIGVGPLEWRSPLEEDDYAEYRDAAFLHRLGVSEEASLAKFWPRGGPQWDGLAVSTLGEIVLIEAKSHASEMRNNCTAKDPDSICLITTSLEECKRALGAEPSSNWLQGYYQYANRLAHTWFLNESVKLPCILAFVYFIDDTTMQAPLSREGWIAEIALTHNKLGLRSPLPSYVREVFVKV